MTEETTEENKQRKRKSKYEDELVEEALVISEIPLNESRSKYEDPDVITYIVDSKSKGKNFNEITLALKDRGYPAITPSTVSDLYYKAVVEATLHHNTAVDKFVDIAPQLNEMNLKRIKIIDELLNVVQRLNNELNACEDMELLDKTMKHIRLYPQIIALLSEFNRVFDSYVAYQDKIEKTKQAVSYKEGDIVEYINKYLKILEKAGKIKVLDPALKEK